MFVPMPAIAAVGLFVSYDLYMALTNPQRKIASAGHLGGAAFGLWYYLARIRPIIRGMRFR